MLAKLARQSSRGSYLAVVKVLSETLASPAYATVWTMVNLLLAVVVP
jgi:hypothetical protein